QRRIHRPGTNPGTALEGVPRSLQGDRPGELLQPRFDALQRLLGERLGAVADPLPGDGPVDRRGGRQGLRFDDLVPAGRVRAAVHVLLAVAAHVALRVLEHLHRLHVLLAARAPGARSQPLVPVRSPTQALVPVADVQAVTGLRGRVNRPRVRVHAVQGDDPGPVAQLVDLADPPVPLIPGTDVYDVLDDPGLHQP